MVKTKNLKLWIAGTALISAGVMTACSTEEQPADGQARFQVRLTDAPGNYEAVWIDVQDILINYGEGEDEGNWESLPGVQTGVYNLLELVNGYDTMLVDATIPSGKIGQIRLVLGEDNWITVDGEDIPLTTPSAQQSGLKLNIHADVTAGIVYSLVLDFDVAKSIVEAGNSGKYILKPVIRTFLDAQGGNIKGLVLPDSVRTAILAISGSDTISTFTADNGAFLFKALEPGSYQLMFIPDTLSGYLPYDTAGIAVEDAGVTDIGVVTLPK